MVADYDLRVDELRLLEDACRTADVIDALNAALEGQPLMVAGTAGQPRPHPLMVEIRQQRVVLAGMLKQLRLPDDTGHVHIHGVPIDQEANARSVKAREAANARWSRRGGVS